MDVYCKRCNSVWTEQAQANEWDTVEDGRIIDECPNCFWERTSSETTRDPALDDYPDWFCDAIDEQNGLIEIGVVDDKDPRYSDEFASPDWNGDPNEY